MITINHILHLPLFPLHTIYYGDLGYFRTQWRHKTGNRFLFNVSRCRLLRGHKAYIESIYGQSAGHYRSVTTYGAHIYPRTIGIIGRYKTSRCNNVLSKL